MSSRASDRTDSDAAEDLRENLDVVQEKEEIGGEESRSSFASSETTTVSDTGSTSTVVSSNHSNADSSTVDPLQNGTESRTHEADEQSTINQDDDLFLKSWLRARAVYQYEVPQRMNPTPEFQKSYDKNFRPRRKPLPTKKGQKNAVKVKVKLPKRIRKSSFEESDLSSEGPNMARCESETITICSNKHNSSQLAPSASKAGVTGRSNEMPHCEVRLLRLEEHQIPLKSNGTSKARVRVSSRGRDKGRVTTGCQPSSMKRHGESPLFADEDPAPGSFKSRKSRIEKPVKNYSSYIEKPLKNHSSRIERPVKNYSSYGREISKPAIYRDVVPCSKSSTKERRKGNLSNGKQVRRALFNSSGSSSTKRRPSSLDSEDSDSDDPKVPCPSPFRYSSEGSPSSATGEFDKENYLERYIRPGPNHPAINSQMIKLIEKARSRAPECKIISKYTLTFKQEHLARYDHLKWLDDPNIDFYLEMIRERNNTVPGFPRVYVFHCFFYKLFHQSGYDAIKETTAKDDIFTYDLAFFPVIIREHWRLIVADFRVQTLKCYDSMFRANDKSLEKVKDYLVREYREKHGPPFTEPLIQEISSTTTSSVELSPPVSDTEGQNLPGGSTPPLSLSNVSVKIESEPAPYLFSDWNLDCVSPDDIPQQKNGSDCGIFLCQYAEYLSRDVAPPFDFNQRNMPYFRVRMAFETITGRLLQSAPPPSLSSTLALTPTPAVISCSPTVSSTTVPGPEPSCNGPTSSRANSTVGIGD